MAKVERLASRLIQQVPLFFGLKPAEMKAFLDICKLSAPAKGEVICKVNTASHWLFILLDGELEVVGQEGTALATLKPITVIGEMGFISRKPRSATVRVRRASRLLKVAYPEFESLTERNPELRAKLYRNLVRILADRLSDANDAVVRYRKLYEAGIRTKGEEGGKPGAAPVAAEEKRTVAQEDDEEATAVNLLQLFYALAQVEVEEEQRREDQELYRQLRREGYSPADLEYAIKWAVRHIPSIRRFSLVKLSIGEAFESKWNI